MADEVRLTAPLVRVLLADGAVVEVQTANPDLVLWDRTSVRKRWPTFQQANFLWMTFIAWAGARRLGLIPNDFTYERWESEALDVQPLDADDGAEGRPTEPGPDPG
jgi:hypothetical protein